MRARPMYGKSEYRYERLNLSNGRVLVVSATFWSDFLTGNIASKTGRKISENRYFMAQEEHVEDYPGQMFFHAHNGNIRRAEENWKQREAGR